MWVPHGRLRVTRCRDHYCGGWGYRALLTLDGQLVGQVRATSASTPPATEAGEHSAVSFHPWTPAFTGEDLTAFAAACQLNGCAVASRQVLALLVEEHRVQQMVRGCAARGATLARFAHEDQMHYLPLRAPVDGPHQRAVALAYLEQVSGLRGSWLIWSDDRWQELSGFPAPPAAGVFP
ncbi:hypothetical protein [Streptosporangium sp. CA-115845]|uniref:hypothetical protein n=1 Tax=Streptosporangium sp. CA-115845 TaxID=3240071 RepID=UPI003D935686